MTEAVSISLVPANVEQQPYFLLALMFVGHEYMEKSLFILILFNVTDCTTVRVKVQLNFFSTPGNSAA